MATVSLLKTRRYLLFAATSLVVIVALFAYLAYLSQRRHCANHGGFGDRPEGKAAIATAHPLATEAAANVLAQGGSAVDAALAAAFMLTVAEPYNSGLGGGGFALVYDSIHAQPFSLDFRERAPTALDVVRLQSALQSSTRQLRKGPLAVAIPSEWDGLVELHRRYGHLSLSQLAKPAIERARLGVDVSFDYSLRCFFRMRELREDESARRIFLGSFGICPLSGTFKQPELALTLERLTDSKSPASWSDLVGRPMVEFLSRGGGAHTLADLANRTPTERPVLTGNFAGRRLLTMSPPAGGGALVINWLQIYEIARRRLPSADKWHLWVEASRLAFHDRSLYMGDPDFVAVPTDRLVSSVYAAEQAARIQEQTSLELLRTDAPPEGQHTTHISIVDSEGLAVAMTLSLNLPFGSGLVVPGTGILLNNEMDDFYARHANAYGLTGSSANAPEARKRPLSSMAPMMVIDAEGQLSSVIGSPGGSRIPTAVASVLRDMLEGGESPQAAIHAYRLHHQWIPDRADAEVGFADPLPETVRQHRTRTWLPIGNVQLVSRTKQGWQGFSDCRGEGKAWSEPQASVGQ